MGSPLAEFLDEIGLSKLLTVLQAESLELEDLAEVEPSEWKAMGVRLGHSKRIRRELRARGALIDSGSMSISGVSNKDTAMPGGPAVVEFRRGPSSAPLRPGAELGPFVLVQELGRGTFGHVWKVDDIQTGTPCALKIVVSATSPRLAQKTLVQEFSVLSRVKDTTHLIRAERPRIERHDGAELLVLPMELADGGTLRDWMLANPRARRGADEDVDRTNRALDLFLSACRGVEALHAADAVHLDLKPANLLLCGGVLKVANEFASYLFCFLDLTPKSQIVVVNRGQS